MPVQRDEAWLASATPEQIAAADDAGELDALQGRAVRTDPAIGTIPGIQRDQGWVDQATPEHIASALDAGELEAYLGRAPWPAGLSDPAKPAQGLYGDGSIVTHSTTPRGDIPHVTGPATTIGTGTDPKDVADRIAQLFTDPTKG